MQKFTPPLSNSFLIPSRSLPDFLSHPRTSQVDVQTLARRTTGLTGADIESIVNYAVTGALHKDQYDMRDARESEWRLDRSVDCAIPKSLEFDSLKFVSNLTLLTVQFSSPFCVLGS